jgi:hypothetical protein
MITINSLDDLLKYLDSHWNELTDYQYCRLLETTLQVYASGKPKDVEVAKADIIRFADFPLLDRPLFIGLDEQN